MPLAPPQSRRPNDPCGSSLSSQPKDATGQVATGDLTTEQTVRPVTEEDRLARHTVCPPRPFPDVDLVIHKPKVIDPNEPEIDDDEELTKGSQTFVNLDNDDQDFLFDTMDVIDDTNVAGEDEMTLLKLKVKNTLLSGEVTLTATAGGGDIKVWDAANKGTEVPLPATFTVPTDFPDVEGIYRVKKLWVEGRKPHSSQQGTTLEMALDQKASNNPDEVALTVIGIKSPKWLGKANGFTAGSNAHNICNFYK